LKIEMTSVDVAALVYELNRIIREARIENIYQLDSQTIVLRLHLLNQPTMQLLVEAGKRVHLTSYVLSKPLRPPGFCMELRKHLRNGKITEIQQHEFERTITLQISLREGMCTLVVELFGDGNIILVNPKGYIVTALTYKRMRDRDITRNETYRNPPSSGKNPLNLSLPQVHELKEYGQTEIVRALTKFISIGGVYAEELLLRAGVDKNIACEELTDGQLSTIYSQLKSLLSPVIEGKVDAAVVFDAKGEPIDVTPTVLKRYEAMDRKPYKTFNEALDEYYTHFRQVERVTEARKQFEKQLAKQQRMLQDQQRTVDESEKAVEQDKRMGDLVYAHFSELQLLVQQILEEKQRGRSWDEIINWLNKEKQVKRTPAIYFESLDSKRQILNLFIEGSVVPIKIDHSIQANAAEYYERMKKAERRLQGSREALENTQKQITELRDLWTKKEEQVQEEAPSQRAKKAWYEKFRWFISSEGFLTVGGKDAVTNEILIKKHTEPQDIVFHAEIIGAPFVTIKTQGKTPTDQAIKEAAQFAASYSRAWREMFSASDVYWVRPDQISKTPPPGQYVEKGSFIIQGTKNYVRSVPLRIAIGLLMQGDEIKVLNGPLETVSKQTEAYVVVTPGKQEGKALVKQIRSLLFQKAPKTWRENISAIPNSELQSCIPFGRGEVTLK
jgi:predicted ribosome quality control (RQC) complex YloA/Tae2 family protein